MAGFYEYVSPDTVKTTVYVSDFQGDGTSTSFTLTTNPFSENNTQVYIDGVYQEKTGYSVLGTVLTFSEAPPNLSGIEVTMLAIEEIQIGTTSADLVSYTPAGAGAVVTDVQTELRKQNASDGTVYTPAGTGAVATTVQSKLRQTVSVEDFGAVGDGVTDDTAAINAAIANNIQTSANNIYKVTAVPSNLSIFSGLGYLLDSANRKIPLGNDFKTRTLNAVRPIPDSQLSWVPFFPKVDGVGNVTTTESVHNYAIRRENPVSSGEMWVDPVNGNDANGGSPALPVKTLNQALRVSTVNDVYMMGSNDPANPAVFAKSDYRNTDPIGNRLKNVIVQGHCKIAETDEDLSALTWTNVAATQVYKATTTTIKIHQLRYTKALDEDGGFLKVPNIPFNTDLATTITDINNSLFGWYHDIATNILYMRAGSGDAFKSFIKGLPANISSRMLFLGTAISFYAPKGSSLIFDGVYLVPLVSGTTRARLYIHSEEPNGIQINNSFTHGIDALGAEYYCENVKATSTSGDNFHGFDSGSVKTLAVEVNCDSSFAGDFGTHGTSAAGTNNGSAMHGTGHVARFGGKYYKNYGPDVVDSGSGAFWNCGVEAFGSTLPGNAIGFDITPGLGRMYLDTCLARDEDLDEIQVNNGAILRTFNTTGIVNEVGTGIEVAYDPFNV